jgi:hypothetical protein
VDPDKFVYCSLYGKCGSGPALVMALVAMAVGNSNRYAGNCAGGSAPEGKGILAGTKGPDVGSSRPAAAKGPAEYGFTCAEELAGRVHVLWLK